MGDYVRDCLRSDCCIIQYMRSAEQNLEPNNVSEGNREIVG